MMVILMTENVIVWNNKDVMDHNGEYNQADPHQNTTCFNLPMSFCL